MKRKILFLPFILIFAIALIAQQYRYTPASKLRMAEQAIAQFYVDTVNEDKLVENAIVGMLENLDPHSTYLTAEETRELNEPLQGNFSGIGITFNMLQDTLYVIQTISGGPSDKVGIIAGDRIIACNDTAISGVKMKNTDIRKRLRGKMGTPVNVTVLRRSPGSADEKINFRIIRDKIPIYSIDAAYMVDKSTGYIRINKFAAETADEFISALDKLKKRGMQNLVLDLTDNGGGYLNAAISLVSELIDKNKLIVFTEGNANPRYESKSSPKGKNPRFNIGRLVLMVNQYSASASEITAGAIQDWDRGVIVGRRTFGKGLVQRPFPFPDGSMMRLTIAHYYTPTGRDIQKPYTKGHDDDYEQDMLNRLNSGELMHQDSIHYNDSLRVYTLNKKRTIFGGGGISPDKFVPLDTTEYTKYYRNILAKGLFNRYAVKYLDTNRKTLKNKYKTADSFIANFDVTNQMLTELKAMADDEKIEFDKQQFDTSSSLFSLIIKSLIGRDMFDEETYFKIFNQHNPIYIEAIRIINSDEYEILLSPLI